MCRRQVDQGNAGVEPAANMASAISIFVTAFSLCRRWRRQFLHTGSLRVPRRHHRGDSRELHLGAFFVAFLIVAVVIVEVTGWCLPLFPPLVVMGFEMFANSTVCPWANRPITLPVACTLTAVGGVLLVSLLGAGSLAAIGSTLLGVVVLRVLNLHVPPAIAVG
jgi:hypothetical protein